MTHSFGGSWTDRKLRALKKYLEIYSRALKEQGFNLYYVDGFSGTGFITARSSAKEDQYSFPLEEDWEEVRKGSAQIALSTEPKFHKYIFIEKSREKYAALKSNISSNFPNFGDKIIFERGDANDLLPEFCRKMTGSDRAVIFLDPYGAEVNWTTLEVVARAEKVDLWYLFPIGIGLMRMLPNNGIVPPKWKARLNQLLGTNEWENFFYKESEPDLLNHTSKGKNANPQEIKKYIISRFKQLFPFVHEKPLEIYNSKNNLMYIFCFMCSNPEKKAIGLARKFANYVLRD